MKTLLSIIDYKLIRARIIGICLFALQIGSCDLPVVEPTGSIPTSNFTFTVENSACTSNCDVSFTNQSQNATSYVWNFGDETPASNDVNPVHSFASSGAYSVSLKAINANGDHEKTLVVNIGPSSTGTAPVACFTPSTTSCTAPCTINFTNCSSNADSYEWDFGDGTAPVSTANPSHQFGTAGSYEVLLTATGTGGSDNATATVTITAAASNVEAIAHTATSGNTSNHLTKIESTLTDNKSDRILIVTPVLGLRNQAALGVYYYSNQWYIYNQDISAINTNEQFNVLVATPDDSYAFVHQTSAANLRKGYISTINHAATNNNPSARIFVTPIWEKSTDYNNHPIGVLYVNNRWEIINLDQANLPVGLKLNVIVSEDDQESMIHTTTSTSIVSDYSMMDDPRTNGKSTAKLFITSNQGTSDTAIPNPRMTGIWYRASQSKWTVFNENSAAMPQGAKFNVLVIE